MSYTAPEVLLFIAAIGVLLQNTITAWRTSNKIDQTLVKTAVIEGHVNSKEARYVEQLSSKDKEIEVLKGVLIEKDRISALLAQSVVQNKEEPKL